MDIIRAKEPKTMWQKFKKWLAGQVWAFMRSSGASNFPGALDSYSTKNAADTISESHINDPQDAIEALEAKVGTGASTPADAKALIGTGAGASAWDVVPVDAGGTGQTTAGAAFVALAAGKLYDSGWFAIAASTTYTITHNLGNSEKCIIQLFQKNTSTGVIAVANDLQVSPASDRYGYTVCTLANNSFKIRTSTAPIFYEDENGNLVATANNAQFKVLVIALE